MSVTSDQIPSTFAEIDRFHVDALPRWHFSGSPETSIGQAEGDPSYLLSRVAAAGKLGSGEIFIANGQPLEVRVFDQSGLFVRHFGASGGGPGEFRSFAHISQTDGTHISVYDEPLARVTRINLLSGEYTLRSVSHQCVEPGGGDPFPCMVLGLVANGTAMAFHRTASGRVSSDPRLTVQDGEERRLGLLNSSSVDSAAAVQSFQNFASVKGPAIVRLGYGTPDLFTGPALFKIGGVIGFGTDEIVIGDPVSFELYQHDTSGVLHRLIRVQADPVAITPRLLDEYRDWAEGATNIPAVTHTYLASIAPDGAVPFFDDLFVDRARRIWLRDYQPFWAFGPRKAEAWTILNSDGIPLARVTDLPGTILEVGDDYGLFLERDELGVESVRMYALVSTRA